MRVIVTAGASGIGLAIARCFVERGNQVWVCDKDEALVSEARGLSLSAAHADVTDAEAVRRFSATAIAAMGGVDVLVNNAGVAGPRSAFDAVSLLDWNVCLATNVTGMFLMAQQVAPHMRRQRAGAIINISTASVRTGLPLRTPYVVSKWAVHGLTLNLARELGPEGIRCNAILPGPIDNPRGRALIEATAKEQGISVAEAEAEALSYVSLRDWIAPAEVGAMAVFLASDKARHVSGQFIGVCGNVEWDA